MLQGQQKINSSHVPKETGTGTSASVFFTFSLLSQHHTHTHTHTTDQLTCPPRPPDTGERVEALCWEGPDSQSTGWVGLGLRSPMSKAGPVRPSARVLGRRADPSLCPCLARCECSGAQSCLNPQGPHWGREFWRKVVPQ